MADAPPPHPSPGWYPDPEQVNTQRYWTGESWTDQRAPFTPPAPGMGVQKGVAIVALGILAAAGSLYVVNEVMQSSRESECAIQQLDRAMGEIEPWEVDRDCR